MPRLPWTKPDPYEQFYLQARAADPRNLIVNRIREAPDGSVFAVKAETHTPEIMARHVKDLGAFFGADLVRIVSTEGLRELLTGAEPAIEAEAAGLPSAIVTAFRAEHDQREAPGIGGHAAALKAAFATFQMAAIVREFGFRALRATGVDADRAAAAAGLGTLDALGRISLPKLGRKVHIADLILTDLPVAVDG
jgi:hypothetical protein